MKHYRHIPPSSCLRGFEATVRLGSVTAAAHELAVTQSAVSHQIRLLEEHVGQPLFLRTGRDLIVSDAGHDYYRSVRGALDQLADGLLRLEPYRKPNSVVVHADSAFLQCCILPHLPELAAAHPEIDPWLAAGSGNIDFAGSETDIAVIRSQSVSDDCIAHDLGCDVLAPAAAPPIAASLTNPADVAACRLIHDERHERWDDWLALAGIGPGPFVGGLNFADSGHAQSAAVQGLGVVLASSVLAAGPLVSGHLVSPFSITLPCPEHWWIVTHPKRLEDPATSTLWSWLTASTRTWSLRRLT